MTLEQQLATTEAKHSAVCEQINELNREALALHEQCRNLRDQIAERVSLALPWFRYVAVR